MKKTVLVVAAALTFMIFYGVGAIASSSPPYDVPTYSRDWHQGYFTDDPDGAGDDVLQNDANDGYGHYNNSTGEYDAIPPSIMDAESFITYIVGKLSSTRVDFGTANNAADWDRTGAAFIIQTMIGTSRNRPPTPGEIEDWKARVRHAASIPGHIEWSTGTSGWPNSYYQISRWDGGGYLNDVAWFDNTGSGKAIIFKNDAGSTAYVIRRQCANPIGQPLPLSPPSWEAFGQTTVSDGTPNPGDTVTNITTNPGATLNFTHYIKNYGPAISSNWFALYGSPQPMSWQVQYFNNTNLSGAPVVARNDPDIYHDWGGGSPVPGVVNSDNFSARWTRSDYFDAGTYTFNTTTDDGVRVYVDGNLVINDWTNHPPALRTANYNMTAGRHTITMEYFEGVGGAVAWLDYYYTTGSGDHVGASWDAQYYANTSLSGAPGVTRREPIVYHATDWTGPGAPIPADGFSARYTKTDYFTAGTYQFASYTDDGVRVYVDGALVINDWNSHAPTSNSGSKVMTSGLHKVVVEYFEGGGPGTLAFSYSMLTQGGLNAGSFGVGEQRVVDTDTITVPAGTPPGTKFCRAILWDWKNSSGVGDPGTSAGMGGSACATVASAYTLVPSVQSSTAVAQVGESVTFSYRLSNTGSGASSALSVCKGAGKVHPPGTPLAEEFADRTSDAGQIPPAMSCPASVASGASNVPVGTENLIIPSSAVPGTQICRSLVINPYNGVGGTFRASAEACVLVAKLPYVHFKGGDVWAGGGFLQPDGTCITNASAKITTSSSQSSSAGSSVEYGAFALGDITKFGSGSKALYNSADFGELGRRLSFSNNTINIGRFGAPQHCMNDYSAIYDSLPVGGALAITNPTSGAWHSAVFPSLSGTAPAGVKKVYYSDTDITITGDIKYPDTYGSAGDIPSILVIAKGNIYVNAGVTRMDGIYIARNTFYTCYPKPTPISTSVCNTQLTVNGAVIAGTLDLYRTFGAEGATPALRQTPAEVFNLSPEVFLNNVLTPSLGQGITTSSMRELPPRF